MKYQIKGEMMVKQNFTKAWVAVIAAVGLSVAVAAPAHADPTGQYEWNCVSPSGSSYFMSAGEPLNNCKGSYLQKYINGAQVEVIPMDGHGVPADPDAGADALSCLIAVVELGYLIYQGRKGKVTIAGAAAAGWGLATCAA